MQINSFVLPANAKLVASVRNSSALAPLGFHDMIELPAGTKVRLPHPPASLLLSVHNKDTRRRTHRSTDHHARGATHWGHWR